MPYKSDSQRKKFHTMLARGEISKAVVDEWDSASKGKAPEQTVKHPQGRCHGARAGAKAKHGGGSKRGKP